MVTTLGDRGSKWLHLGGLGSLAFSAREKASTNSPCRSASMYSTPSSNCSSEASPRAAHLEPSPSSIELLERQELVESVLELTPNSWQGGESESAFDSLWVQQERERETSLISWQGIE